MKNLKTLMLAGAGAMLVAQSADAAMTYANGDLLLGFRKDAATSNLEVNLGSINQIKNIAGTGQVLDFSTKFTSADILAGVGTVGAGSLNNAIWSVSGSINALNQNGITAGTRSVWLTSARGINSADVNTQTTPWTRAASQGSISSAVLTVGGGFAAANGNAGSTTAAVIANGANSYHDNIGDGGDFATFQGNIENTLSGTFTTGGTAARSDLYELQQGAGNGTFLGYFELGTTGALTFVAVPEASSYATAFGAALMALALMRAHRKSEAHN